MVRRFLENLYLEGRGRIGPADPPSAGDIDEGADWVAEFERESRRHLPGTPPGLEGRSLRWSLGLFYRGAQCVVHRHLGEEVVARDLSVSCPVPTTDSVTYSVDLTFRFLPDLMRLARAASESDPLVGRLAAWGRDWPLSSVGMTLPDGEFAEPFLDHPALRGMYLDRIIAAGDRSRLRDPRVAAALASVAGAYGELTAHLGLGADSQDVIPPKGLLADV